jgi:hypothetical protein
METCPLRLSNNSYPEGHFLKREGLGSEAILAAVAFRGRSKISLCWKLALNC